MRHNPNDWPGEDRVSPKRGLHVHFGPHAREEEIEALGDFRTTTIRLTTQMMDEMDAAARRLGVSRSAWLRMTIRDRLDQP
ncbi:MAG: ribbon-helix-helix protein, CopG family [Pseudomonadota bacterium]